MKSQYRQGLPFLLIKKAASDEERYDSFVRGGIVSGLL